MWPRTDDIVLALLAPFLGLLLARQQWQLAALAAMIGLILLVSRLLASRRADDRRPAGDEDPPHPNGQLMAQLALVNEQLQLGSSSRVYAMGDCMHHRASDEAKLGHTAELNAHVVAENVRRQRRRRFRYPRGTLQDRAAGERRRVCAAHRGRPQ